MDTNVKANWISLISLIALVIGLLLMFVASQFSEIFIYCGGVCVLIAFVVPIFNFKLKMDHPLIEHVQKISSYIPVITSDEALMREVAKGITIIEPNKYYSNLKHEMNVILQLPDFIHQGESFVELKNFSETKFPEPLANKIYYDTTKKRLIFKGIMSLREMTDLLKLSQDKQYQDAVGALYQQSLDKGLIFVPRRGIISRTRATS